MEKTKAGLVAIGLLIILQGFGWYFGKDGMLQSSIFSLIGLVAGAIFGFSLNKKER